MEVPLMHKDVLDTIFHYRLKEWKEASKNGKKIPDAELIDTLQVGLVSTQMEALDFGSDARKYGEMVIEIQKQKKRENIGWILAESRS
jgi:hypothetical protein